MLDHHRNASETPFKWRLAGGSMMARLWWYLYLSLIKLKKNNKITLSKLDPLWQNFLDPRMNIVFNSLPASDELCRLLLQKIWAQIRPHRMSGFILFKTVWQSGDIHKRNLQKKKKLKKKNSTDDKINHEELNCLTRVFSLFTISVILYIKRVNNNWNHFLVDNFTPN